MSCYNLSKAEVDAVIWTFYAKAQPASRANWKLPKQAPTQDALEKLLVSVNAKLASGGVDMTVLEFVLFGKE